MNRRQFSDSEFVDKLSLIIEDNLKNEKFGVSELAREIGTSRTNLYQKVKSITHKSVSRFISEIRLKKAMELLKQTALNVSEVSYEVGFGSPTYFIKCFHDYYGFPPGEVKPEDSDKLEKTELPIDKPKPVQQKRKIRKPIIISSFILILLILMSVFMTTSLWSQNQKTEKSIAVLPLHNLTGNPDNDYFADGLQDAIIGQLGQISSLRVISRTSTLRFRKSNLLLKDIARQLDVDIIMEGSLIGAGDSLRVLIQLIDVYPNERHLLAKEYNDVMKNALSVQSSAVKEIAQTIRVKLTNTESDKLDQVRTVNPETYKAYLRGMYYVQQGSEEEFEKGISYLEDAIKNDPGDPLAYAGLALCYATKGHGVLDPAESFQRAMSAAQKAIKLAPSQDEAYTAMALLYLYDLWDWPKAKQTFEEALKNNPNNAVANAHFAWYYVLFNDFDKAVYYGEQAIKVDPMSAGYQSWLSLLYRDHGQEDKAVATAKRALELNNQTPYSWILLAEVSLDRKEFNQAIAYLENLPDDIYWDMYRAYIYLKVGQREKALAYWEHYKNIPNENPCMLGVMAAFLGYTDRAFELLNEAVDRKIYPVPYFVNGSGFTESLATDRRLNELRRKLNLPELDLKLAVHP
ncbi:helix-turn-helix domain-containing protein [Mangrovibacterium diazotrophicum]|uniref:TolB-like protein n=1 Tax=Mangrovibacterium diazotrophicum TaxID=1261403 RepID=A0A419W6N6_9BACT|nr:helix-turn-helix domain-containing protein [Mangrovibacterium diazotrophicum]RKD91042.1 TolB-like protein [Mangrovibacterium diazotrophicum]